MTALGIILTLLLSTMAICYIAMRHEHREEERTEKYLYRHRNDEDKLRATADVAAAYKELVTSGILQ